ncbi:MAG: diacylglycerol kinase family protein [Gemmataceae bacterium]
MILANPHAGPRGHRRRLHELVDALHARGLTAELCWQRDALGDRVGAAGDRLRCVVAAGGDGTLNEVLNRAPGAPVALLPIGTENLMARYFRLDRAVARTAEAIATAPVRRFDLARIDGRYFSLMAGFGIDARVVHDVHRWRQGHITRLSYVLPIARAITSYRFPPIEVVVEDTGERLVGATVFLFNFPVYGMRLQLGRDARPDDGALDLVVFERSGLLNLARYLTAALFGRHTALPDVQHRRVRRVRLSSARDVPVQTDGDPAGVLPVTVEVVPAAFGLLLPSST